MIKIDKIIYCDTYRDGGSYGLSFYSKDNLEYELFLRIIESIEDPFSGETVKKYDFPVIYEISVNTGNLVESLNWEEANFILKKIKFQNDRYLELIKIISNKGISTTQRCEIFNTIKFQIEHVFEKDGYLFARMLSPNTNFELTNNSKLNEFSIKQQLSMPRVLVQNKNVRFDIYTFHLCTKSETSNFKKGMIVNLNI